MDVVKLLKELVSVKSLPGGEESLANTVKEYLGYTGVDKVFIDSVGNVIAPVRGGGLGVVVVEGHLDTVDAGDLSQWVVDPFSGAEIEGRVYGRGTVDMKGAIASQIKSLEDLRSLESDLYVVYTVHEEIIEGVALRHALRDSLRIRPDVIVTGEATSLKLGLGHRGRAVVDLEISGVSAHASMPSEGINSLEGAALAVLRVADMSSKLPSHELLGSESATATLIDCQPKIQPQIPDKCLVTVDHRLLPGRSEADIIRIYEDVCSQVKNLRNAGCKPLLREEETRSWKGYILRTKELFPGWINEDASLTKTLIGSLKKVYNNISRHYWRFSTDLVIVSEFNARGIGLGPGEETLAHKPNEYVEIAELRKAVDMYRLMFQELSSYLSSRVR
ncbi:MAG: M20/M25/M40 family metallo-hydrolase [Thermoprotei archaeon]